jgi:hypothetical protein
MRSQLLGMRGVQNSVGEAVQLGSGAASLSVQQRAALTVIGAIARSSFRLCLPIDILVCSNDDQLSSNITLPNRSSIERLLALAIFIGNDCTTILAMFKD